MTGYVAELRSIVGHRPLLLVSAGVIVKNTNGAILLQRRADDGHWGIPGGAMELGETLEETARRELNEETGVVAEDLTLIDVFSGPEFFLEYANGDQAYVVGATYLAGRVHGTLRPDGRESTELQYFPPTELPPELNDFNRQLLTRCWDHLT
jgi:ADP-ribose pyrophosphatase YjhB (NUDIX family)